MAGLAGPEGGDEGGAGEGAARGEAAVARGGGDAQAARRQGAAATGAVRQQRPLNRGPRGVVARQPRTQRQLQRAFPAAPQKSE